MAPDPDAVALDQPTARARRGTAGADRHPAPRRQERTRTATPVLFVQPTGTRGWVQRLVIRGRRAELGLGSATLVPLAKAREHALAYRMLAWSGGDPLADERGVQRVPIFAESRPTRDPTEARRLAGLVARTELEHGTVCVPPQRQPARLRGQHSRRAGDPHRDLVRQRRRRPAPSGRGDGDHILWTDTAQEDLNRDVVRMLFRAAGNSDSKVGLAVEAPA